MKAFVLPTKNNGQSVDSWYCVVEQTQIHVSSANTGQQKFDFSDFYIFKEIFHLGYCFHLLAGIVGDIFIIVLHGNLCDLTLPTIWNVLIRCSKDHNWDVSLNDKGITGSLPFWLLIYTHALIFKPLESCSSKKSIHSPTFTHSQMRCGLWNTCGRSGEKQTPCNYNFDARECGSVLHWGQRSVVFWSVKEDVCFWVISI